MRSPRAALTRLRYPTVTRGTVGTSLFTLRPEMEVLHEERCHRLRPPCPDILFGAGEPAASVKRQESGEPFESRPVASGVEHVHRWELGVAANGEHHLRSLGGGGRGAGRRCLVAVAPALDKETGQGSSRPASSRQATEAVTDGDAEGTPAPMPHAVLKPDGVGAWQRSWLRLPLGAEQPDQISAVGECGGSAGQVARPRDPRTGGSEVRAAARTKIRCRDDHSRLRCRATCPETTC